MEGTVVVAPTSLGIETRALFRQHALAALDALPASGPGRRLVVDLSGTLTVDSAGLGVLALIQRRAAEVKVSVCLAGASEAVRYLLVMTRLEDRFLFDPPTA